VAATQLQANSADITVIVAHVNGRKLIIVLVYILDLYLRRTKKENLKELTSRLEIINRLVLNKLLRNLHTEVVITGDFN
jgi:exonuclease III